MTTVGAEMLTGGSVGAEWDQLERAGPKKDRQVTLGSEGPKEDRQVTKNFHLPTSVSRQTVRPVTIGMCCMSVVFFMSVS